MLSQNDVTHLLSEHASRLLAGDDVTERLAERYHGYPEVVGLLYLARRLSQALAPVEPAPPFVHALGRRLHQDGRAPRPSLPWMLLATAGSLLSLVGVTLLWHRRGRTLLRTRVPTLN